MTTSLDVLASERAVPRPFSTPKRVRARGPVITAAAIGVAGLIAYLIRTVPVDAPRLARPEAVRHWPAAVAGAAIVGAVVAGVIGAVVVRRRGVAVPGAGCIPAGGSVVPPLLRWEAVPRRVLLVALVVSAWLAAVAVASRQQLSFVALAALVPWLPLFALEGASKRRRYGVFAAFLGVVLFQTLHMGEHSVQVAQLLVTQGDLAHSHGVFGQLDFETVHFVADSVVWLAVGWFLWRFGGANRWLWVAFAAASLHQIEHFYLFWMYHVHPAVYDAGGSAGIMGSGGLIGSPVGRPYLHFTYNAIVVVPMLVALWDQARMVEGERSSGSEPRRV
jgi:hypothetical protein